MTFRTLVTSVSLDQEGHACTRMGVRDQFVALLVARVHEVLRPSAVDPVHAQSNSIDLIRAFNMSRFLGFRYLLMLLTEHIGFSSVRLHLVLP
jgi:hypothetical protein